MTIRYTIASPSSRCVAVNSSGLAFIHGFSGTSNPTFKRAKSSGCNVVIAQVGIRKNDNPSSKSKANVCWWP